MAGLTPQTITGLAALAAVILVVIALQAVNRYRRSRRADPVLRGGADLNRARLMFLAAIALLCFLVVSLALSALW